MERGGKIGNANARFEINRMPFADRDLPTMLRRILGCFMIAALLWQFWPPHNANAQTSNLLIGEVAWAGSPLSNADEWLELWNLSDEPISLEGYALEGAGPDEGIVFDESHVIEANSAFLIANYAPDHENAAHVPTPNIVTTSISLPNASLELSLFDPDGALIDRVGDGSSADFGTVTPKASMVRPTPSADGWKTATDSRNFKADIEVFGTPGFCDGCGDGAAEEETVEGASPSEDSEIEHESSSEEDDNDLQENTATSTAASRPLDPDVEVQTTEEEVTKEANESETQITEASVSAPSAQFPEVDLKISGSFTAGEKMHFDASSSTDPNGDIVYFTWNFGDGISATGSKATHVYETAGEYEFELIATDTTFRTFATTTLEVTPAPLPAPDVFLNEIHPAPEDGAEWVELYGLNEENVEHLIGWSIEDENGKAFQFSSSSIETIEFNEPFALIKLLSSKLNNSGDSVLLKRSDGSLADGVMYEKTKKGMSWIRFPDQTGDWRDAKPSKLDENTYIKKRPRPTLANLYVNETTAGNEILAETETATLKAHEASTVMHENTQSDEEPNNEAIARVTLTRKTSATDPGDPVNPAVTLRTHSSTELASAKNISGENESGPLQTSIKQLMTIPPNTEIELSGIVGSKPGMLGKHKFVLLAPNGRGLYVKASNKQPSPEFGSKIHIKGTLMYNDDGLYVRMGTKDRWQEDPGNTTAKVRSTNLEELGLADGWSLVQLTGYVIETTKTKALIDTKDGLIEVNFKEESQYKASRLNEQDKIRVTGLLDMTETDLKLFPRDPSEVEILEHSTLDQADNPATASVPGWVPFGAAGLTVAVTEGVKRLRKWKYEQKVQKLINESKD